MQIRVLQRTGQMPNKQPQLFYKWNKNERNTSKIMISILHFLKANISSYPQKQPSKHAHAVAGRAQSLPLNRCSLWGWSCCCPSPDTVEWPTAHTFTHARTNKCASAAFGQRKSNSKLNAASTWAEQQRLIWGLKEGSYVCHGFIPRVYFNLLILARKSMKRSEWICAGVSTKGF